MTPYQKSLVARLNRKVPPISPEAAAEGAELIMMLAATLEVIADGGNYEFVPEELRVAVAMANRALGREHGLDGRIETWWNETGEAKFNRSLSDTMESYT